MKKQNPEIIPAKILRVQKNFERWRTKKRGKRDPIPLKLWRAAAKLCKSYSIHRVSRMLRVDPAKLKDHVEKSPRGTQKSSRSAFVEWSPPTGNVSVSAAEYIVELADREGGVQRIHVRGANIAEVAALSRELRSGGG